VAGCRNRVRDECAHAASSTGNRNRTRRHRDARPDVAAGINASMPEYGGCGYAR
jgi:hypothetical protein